MTSTPAVWPLFNSVSALFKMQLWFCPTHLFTKLKPLHWSPTTTLMIKTQCYHKICPVFTVWIPSLLVLCCPTAIPFCCCDHSGYVVSLILGATESLYILFLLTIVYLPLFFSSVQSLSRVRLFVTPSTAACQASPSITNSQSLPRLTSVVESVMPSKHLILCHPLLLLLSIFRSIRVFSNESALHIRWPKYYWSFSFSISPFSEHPGLISFKMDWLDLLAAQESSPTPQFKSINSSVLSFLYSSTLTCIHDYWKNHSLDKMDLCWQSNVSAFWYAV